MLRRVGFLALAVGLLGAAYAALLWWGLLGRSLESPAPSPERLRGRIGSGRGSQSFSVGA